jgi:hypothetical protein
VFIGLELFLFVFVIFLLITPPSPSARTLPTEYRFKSGSFLFVLFHNETHLPKLHIHISQVFEQFMDDTFVWLSNQAGYAKVRRIGKMYSSTGCKPEMALRANIARSQ